MTIINITGSKIRSSTSYRQYILLHIVSYYNIQEKNAYHVPLVVSPVALCELQVNFHGKNVTFNVGLRRRTSVTYL